MEKIPKKRAMLNLERKYRKMILQGNTILKNEYNAPLDQPEYAKVLLTEI